MIAFKHHWPIDSKLCQPKFNYLKFHAVTHFAYYIRDYDSAVNYDTAHSKAAHKYFLKAFYNRTNKKEYNAQIWQHNICHINVIVMKDVIILKKALEKEGQLVVRNANKIALTEFGRTLSSIDLDSKYIRAISNVDIDAPRNLGLTDIKRYWKLAGQIEKEVNELHKDWIPAFAIFVKHSWKMHDNEKVTENMKIRRDIDPRWALSLFVQLYESIYYWKMDGKDITDATKLVNKLVRCSWV